jgi:hypothetical protein
MGRLCFFNTTPFWGGGEKWHRNAAREDGEARFTHDVAMGRLEDFLGLTR